ncbi:hypothetical protein RvY_07119-2 [Ramazzottius varieornatus]|uniref:NADP-dependent oxidoreductase domain-containing protein n=1 Tax=Ramazzottius varieornatus TaxID=947166 RepID=A0A1D1V482_RAMVA|nr:hypothetical protein RvY_07119-2 [Ramazzottius varieornatus]
MDVASLRLNSGRRMPIIGMGTSEKKPHFPGSRSEMKEAVSEALRIGYRHFDCAFVYKNEAEVGEALKEAMESGQVLREDLFITTKLPPHYNDPALVREALDSSLKWLKLDYVDLYLIHVPFSIDREYLKAIGEEKMYQKPEEPDKFYTSMDHSKIWQGMEKLVDEGLVRSIGLSNFNQQQIQHVIDNCSIKPANLQVECHAYLPERELLNFCNQHKIVLTAFAPLGSPAFAKATCAGEPVLLEDPVVKKVGDKHKKSPAQVLLRWLIQRNICVLPKSVNKVRLKENFDVLDFALDEADVEEMNTLGTKNLRYFLYEPSEDSPDYPFPRSKAA